MKMNLNLYVFLFFYISRLVHIFELLFFMWDIIIIYDPFKFEVDSEYTDHCRIFLHHVTQVNLDLVFVR